MSSTKLFNINTNYHLICNHDTVFCGPILNFVRLRLAAMPSPFPLVKCVPRKHGRPCRIMMMFRFRALTHAVRTLSCFPSLVKRLVSAWFIRQWSGSTPLHVSDHRSWSFWAQKLPGGTFFAVLLIARVIAYEAYWQSFTVLFSLCLPCALRLPRAKFLSSADILWLVPPIVIYSSQYFARHLLVLLLKM